MKTQVLREIFEVTEWRGDAVYKTRSTGYHWIDHGLKFESRNTIVASPSTSVMKKLNYVTMRRVPETTPEVVKVEI